MIKQGITNWVWFSSEFDLGKPQIWCTVCKWFQLIQRFASRFHSIQTRKTVQWIRLIESLLGVDSVLNSSTEKALRESGNERIVNQVSFNSELNKRVEEPIVRLDYCKFWVVLLNSDSENQITIQIIMNQVSFVIWFKGTQKLKTSE